MSIEIQNDPALPRVLHIMTFATGLIDAASFLGMGRVFTANMTGNVILLGFALAGTAELSVARSATALLAFMLGAVIGGRIIAYVGLNHHRRLPIVALTCEAGLLALSACAALGFTPGARENSVQLFAVIGLSALAMGLRNATVRALAIADLTTTVLTLTITSLASESTLAGGTNPRLQRRIASISGFFAGAAIGAFLIQYSLALTLGLATLVALAALAALCTLYFNGATPAPE